MPLLMKQTFSPVLQGIPRIPEFFSYPAGIQIFSTAMITFSELIFHSFS